MAEPALSLDQLSVARAGRTVVTEAALTVAPGEVLALLGANGAGKSSLIGAVSGAHASAGGRVLLGGGDITGLGADRRARIGLGLVPEGRRVFAGLTVRENLDVACHDTDQRANRLADCLRGLRELGYGLLIVEHNVRFLTALCDRLTCLDAGLVIASGAPDDVCADPAVREAYLGPDHG